MSGKTCCFTGHRTIPKGELFFLKRRLKKQLCALIEAGVTDFFAGGAPGANTLAAETVLKLRGRYAQIRLTLLPPAGEGSRAGARRQGCSTRK